MEGGERKEEASLPPDYVSLAQLQERWLQKKQEEIKRKEKQEEEEKRESDARVLRQKHEEDEKRRREARAQNQREGARAQNERNRNQRESAKMGGGSVRATGVIEEKGKGKEVVRGGLGNGGENNKKKWGNGGRRKGSYFKGAAAVEEKDRVGAEGGAGGSGGGGSSGVEEVGLVCMVEILPRNGEIGHVKRSDFKKNGRNKVSATVNEFKQSELAIELEKEEEEGEKDCGKKWRGRGRGSGIGSERGERRGERSEEGGERGRGSEEGGQRGGERGGGKRGWRERRRNEGDPESMSKECRPVVVEGNGVDLKLEDKAADEISEICSERTSLRVGDRNNMRGRGSKAKEDGVEGQGSNGDKVAVEIGKKVDHKAIARKGEKGGSGTGYRAIGIRGCDNKAKEEGVEGEGSNGEIVEVEFEKKVDHKVLPRKGENRDIWRAHQANGSRGRDNEAKEVGVEGEGSNGEIMEAELEKKVDYKVLPRKSGNRGLGRACRANGIRGQDNEAKEEGVEGEGLNGEIVEVELDKKVDHKVLPRKGENRGFGKNRANGIQGRDNKSTEDGAEGESSNGDKEAVVIVKTVYPKALPRNGQNWSFGRGYRANGNRGGGFGTERKYTRPEISDDCKMQGRERCKVVWVKKEDKLDA